MLSRELKVLHQITKALEELSAEDAAAARRVEDWLRAKLRETETPPLPGMKR